MRKSFYYPWHINLETKAQELDNSFAKNWHHPFDPETWTVPLYEALVLTPRCCFPHRWMTGRWHLSVQLVFLLCPLRNSGVEGGVAQMTYLAVGPLQRLETICKDLPGYLLNRSFAMPNGFSGASRQLLGNGWCLIVHSSTQASF